MRIKVKCTNINLTKEMWRYLGKRLNSLERVVDLDDDKNICFVELARTTANQKSGEIYKAEINCYLGGRDFRACSTKGDMYSAINTVKDEIKNELTKNKYRAISLERKGGQLLKKMLKEYSGTAWRD